VYLRGLLPFTANLKSKYPNRRSGLNATEVTSYQYLGMTKIAGAHEVVGVLQQILKAFFVLNVGEYYCQ
jgi:hypothetical protein